MTCVNGFPASLPYLPIYPGYENGPRFEWMDRGEAENRAENVRLNQRLVVLRAQQAAEEQRHRVETAASAHPAGASTPPQVEIQVVSQQQAPTEPVGEDRKATSGHREIER